MRRFGRIGAAPWTAAAAMAVALGATPALAASKEDRVFTVGNYPVEARAADAVTAKDRAIADGQQAALRSLMRRIVPVNAYNRLSRLKSVKAAELVQGLSVRSERNSSTEYIASYDIVFQAEAVRRILDREGIPFLDRQAPQIVLLPVYRAPAEAGTPEMFTDARGSDAWLYAWKGLDLSNALTPVALHPVKKEVHPDSIKALVAGDPAAVRTVGREYQTETVLVAQLEPDLAQKKVAVTIAGRDAVAPFVLKRSYKLDGPDLAYTAELAAVLALGVLEGRWKAINVRGGTGAELAVASRSGGEDFARPSPVPRSGGEAGGDGPLRIAVEFNGMSEWQRISRQLSETPSISDLDVEGLSAHGARLSLRYPGGLQELSAALVSKGLALRNGGNGWVLSAR